VETLTNFEYKVFAFKDSWKTIALTAAMILTIYLTLTWITTNITGQIEIVFILILLLSMFAIGYAANILKEKIKVLAPLPIGTVDFGFSPKTIGIFTIIGLGLSYFLVTQNLTVALPLDITFEQFIPGMDYIYKVWMSPIVEELWRGFVLITTALITLRFTKNWWISLFVGLTISALTFGIFHWLAYQQDFTFITAAIIFGLIAGMLMILTKSVWPAMAFHFANNQLIYAQGDPTGIFIVGGLVTAFGVVAFIRGWQ